MRTFPIAIALLLVGCASTTNSSQLNARNERKYTLFPDPDTAANGTTGEVRVIGGKGKGLGPVFDDDPMIVRSAKVAPVRTTAVRSPGRVTPPSRPGHV